jgi:exopolysaccharide biosynthesis operon protein EpsL
MWRAGASVAAEDNFLRAPAGAQRSEQITTQSVGFSVSVPYSLQRFELDAGVVNNQHREFSNFDYVAHNYNAAWRWSYTPRLRGAVTLARTETLNAASDSVNSGLRNRSVATSNGVSAVYELGGALQLSAGAARTASISERPLVDQAPENRADSYNIGLLHSFASGNSLGYTLRYDNGSSSSDYRLMSHQLNGVWRASGSTTVTTNLSYLEQRFGPAPQYDFSGVGGGANIAWRITGKTDLSLGWQRELASAQSAGSIYARTDRLTLAPSWAVSARSSVRLQFQYATRSDVGSPVGTPSGREDRLQDSTLTYAWQPLTNASFTASLNQSTRTSNVSTYPDFVARRLSLGGQVTF